MEGVPTSRIETLPPLPTKEDRLYGALLFFRKTKEGPLPQGVTKITVTPREIALIQGYLLAENLVLKKDYKLDNEQLNAIHITPEEIKKYIRTQEDITLSGVQEVRVLRPVTRHYIPPQEPRKEYAGVPLPTHPPVKPFTEVDDDKE